MSKAMNLFDAITEIIDKIDFVIVVRCKDCKHYSMFKNGQGQCLRQICCVTLPDDYCSYGEKVDSDDE